MTIFRRLSFIAIAFLGCGYKSHLSGSTSSDGMKVNVEITAEKISHGKGDESSLMYGAINFEGAKWRAAKINLSCIEISIGNAKSKKIYIDSVAYIFADKYFINNGKKIVDVYWEMDGRVKPGDISYGLKIHIKDGCSIMVNDYGN